MVVSVLPKVSNMTLSPLTLSGNAQELDKEFMNTIFSPIQKTFNIASNKEEYEKQLKEEVKEEKTKTKKVVKEEVKAGLFNEQEKVKEIVYDNPVDKTTKSTTVTLEDKSEKPIIPITVQKDWTKEVENIEALLNKTQGEDTSAILDDKVLNEAVKKEAEKIDAKIENTEKLLKDTEVKANVIINDIKAKKELVEEESVIQIPKQEQKSKPTIDKLF